MTVYRKLGNSYFLMPTQNYLTVR